MAVNRTTADIKRSVLLDKKISMFCAGSSIGSRLPVMSDKAEQAARRRTVNGTTRSHSTSFTLSDTVPLPSRDLNRMQPCLDEDEVIAFTSGRATEAGRRRIEQHIGECQGCLAWVAIVVRGRVNDSDNALAQTIPMQQPGPGGVSETLPLDQTHKDTERYKLIGLLGSGAMGVVYRAYDRALERYIALKLIRSDSAGDSGLKVRLVAEAHALAKMTHPNVVTIHDLGIHGDEIFIAMELIEGPTLRAHLQEARAGWKEIVAYYLQAARGLAAAHDHGLIHRDFKPDNVLVSGSRVVVTDFGLVRPILEDSDKHVEGEPVGTPAYMAPEQFRGEAADQRTDIFNFCASVYESIYRESPFPGDSVAQRRAAVLTNTRRLPSSQVQIPSYLRSTLQKGLAPDRADRFSSMRELIDIFSEILSSEARRRRRQVYAASAIAIVALSFGGTFVWRRLVPRRLCRQNAGELSAYWSKDARPKILSALRHSRVPFRYETWQTLDSLLSRYVESWGDAYAQQCDAAWGMRAQSFAAVKRLMCLDEQQIAVKEFADLLATGDGDVWTRSVISAPQLEPPLSCGVATPDSESYPAADKEQSRQPINDSRRKLGAAAGLEMAGKYERAAAAAESALQTARAIEFVPLEADALFRLASIRKDQGKWSESERLFTACVDAAERARNDLLRAKSAIGLLYVVGSRQRRSAEGARWAHQAEVVLARLGNPSREMAALRAMRALLRLQDGQLDQAEDDLRAALMQYQQLLPANDSTIGFTLGNLGIVAQAKGKYWEAASLYGQAYALLSATLGSQHPRSGDALADVGYVLLTMGRLGEAKQTFERALAVQTLGLEGPHPFVATTLMNVANVYDSLGNHQQALSYGTQALDIVQALDPASDQLFAVKLNIANYVAELGQFARAQKLANEVLVFRRQRYGANHASVGDAECWIATYYLYQHRFADAFQHANAALNILDRERTSQNPQVADALDVVGAVELVQGHPANAVAAHRRALTIRAAHGGGPQLSDTRTSLGVAEIALGAQKEGLADLEAAMRSRAAQEGYPEEKAQTEFALARSLYAQPQQSARAVHLARAALEAFSHSGLRWATDARDARRWLAGHVVEHQQGETRQ
jgi:serine/threonine protein kinase